MTTPMAVFTFINGWWIALFIMLPLSREYGKPGDATPKKIFWRRAVVGAAVLSAIGTGAIAFAVKEFKL